MRRTFIILALNLLFILLCLPGYGYVSTWTNAGSKNHIHSIAIEDNYVWVGTHGGGVVRWTNGSKNPKIYNTSHGLIDNTVLAIEIDNNGTKWFGTSKWVSKHDGTSWISYTKADGLAGDYVYTIAIESDGAKWFGTTGGASRYDGSA